jgi:hypothetical protein
MNNKYIKLINDKIMKKSLVLMAMAGLALASCVNDVADVAQSQIQKKTLIGFDAPVTYANG